MLIGIDLGTSTCKIIAVDPDGKVVAVASRDYPMINLRPGWAEQEPDAWWRATGEAMTDLTSQLPDGGGEVVGIGMCGQMHGLTPLDADGEVIRPAILWNDQRAAAECDWITEQAGGLDELLRMTRNRMLPGFTGGKIIWLRDHEPDHLRPDGAAAQPEGLHPVPDDGCLRDRGLRRLRHRPVRRGAPHLVDRAPRQDRRRPVAPARRGRVDRADRDAHRRPLRGLGPARGHAGVRRRRRRRHPDHGDGADRGGLGRLHHRHRGHRRRRALALPRQPRRPGAGQRRQRAGALAHHGRLAERRRRLPVAARRADAAERLAAGHLRAADLAGEGGRARRRRPAVPAVPARRAVALRRPGRQREPGRALADAQGRAHLPRRARGRAHEPPGDPRGLRRRGSPDRPDHRVRRRDQGAALAAAAGRRARARGRDRHRRVRRRRVRGGAGGGRRRRGLAGPPGGARPGARSSGPSRPTPSRSERYDVVFAAHSRLHEALTDVYALVASADDAEPRRPVRARHRVRPRRDAGRLARRHRARHEPRLRRAVAPAGDGGAGAAGASATGRWSWCASACARSRPTAPTTRS